MSNSIKQERINAREEKLNRKLQAEQEEKKAKTRQRTGLIVGAVLLVVAVLLGIFITSGALARTVPALRVNDQTYSAAQVSYYYANEYWQIVNTYGTYASYFGYSGLDVNAGIATLGDQPYTNGDEYATWKDYFLASAENTIRTYQALNDYAVQQGIALDAEDEAAVDASLDSLEQNVKNGGYKSLDLYFEAAFGNGVNRSIAREILLRQTLAQKAYEHASDGFSAQYSDEELSEYYDSLEGERDNYNFWYYLLSAETVDSEPDAEGNVTSEVTDETLTAAQEKAQAIVEAFRSDEGTADLQARFDAAITTQVADAACNARENAAASGLNSDYKEWITDAARKQGDIGIIPNSSGTGYYILVYGSHDDNHYPTVTIRDILINVVTAEDGTYTEQALEEARVKAEGVYTQWKNGEATEESFAALAEEFSDDTSTASEGGLVENIYKGQMPDGVDDFCFGERKAGDAEVVESLTAGYAGYHVLYYVGEGELYSNYLSRTELAGQDTEEWFNALLEGYAASRLSGLRYVGK